MQDYFHKAFISALVPMTKFQGHKCTEEVKVKVVDFLDNYISSQSLDFFSITFFALGTHPSLFLKCKLNRQYFFFFVVFWPPVWKQWMLASLQVCFKVAWFCFSGHYMFIETSAPRIRGDNALLLSPQHPASSGDVCVTFYYHMHGSTIGTLNLRVGHLLLLLDSTPPPPHPHPIPPT